MSVFLRWGIFGILGVAGLLYAYNASKRLAEARAARPPPPRVAAPAPAQPEAVAARATPAPSPPATALSVACEEELAIATLALEMRDQGDPIDRVLRTPEIAWQQDATRRERLQAVATRWHAYDGAFAPDTLRAIVAADCEPATPAP